jgi:hypothetical protein
MTSSETIRASDADREVVVATLRDAYTAGRLTMEEFDERTTLAYAAKTWGDLRRLTADLPAQPVLGADVPGRNLPPAQLPVHPPRVNPPPTRQRGSGRPAAFIPVLMLLLIAIATRSGALLAPALVALLVLAMVAGARRR